MAKRAKNALSLTAAVLLGLLSATAVTTPRATAAERGGPLVRTTEGSVQGFVNNGVNSFLGIPFAAAPVGALRWQPPQPRAAWTQTLDATKFGNTCPQITELGVFAGPVSVTEDCLFLNVFTPSHGAAVGSKKLPVLVWIHGGGLF
ncbi:MAG: carboxylesterase family protein, partial [Acetobacteraceae bacterium]